jgi:hypothetical protein
MTFRAFDDSFNLYKPKSINTTITSNQVNFDYDHLRQGVEMTSAKYLYAGTQPKLWAGTNNFNDIDIQSDLISHQINISTYGQAVGFTEYEGNAAFEDASRFDPVTYIRARSTYPSTMSIDVPMNKQEAIIEPFTIPFRLKTTEGPLYSHRICGELEDGNNFLDPFKSANRVQQFIELTAPTTPVYFVDIGQRNIGGITVDSFTGTTQRLTPPFDDTQLEFVANKVRTFDTSFTNKLIDMEVNNDGDIRPLKQKSATAGFVFGDSGEQGTDSIAFGGTFRGV